MLPETYRAEATVVLARQGEAPGQNAQLAGAAEAAAELLESRAVAESAAANLRLEEPAGELLDRIEVETDARSSLLRLTVNGDERDEARRTAQEVAQVFTVLYNARFGPAVTASLWEGARVDDDPVSPRPVVNLALGGLLGAAIGVAVAALRGPIRRRRSVDGGIAALTARERELARRAAELSLSERELSIAPATARSPARSGTSFALPERGEWTIRDVDLLVAEHGSAYPERAEELSTYLESIRSVAEPNGRLPSGVEVIVEDVFADLIERALMFEAKGDEDVSST